MVEDVTGDMYDFHWQKNNALGHHNMEDDWVGMFDYNWQRNRLIRQHDYSVSRPLLQDADTTSITQLIRSWLGTHEEAQVMLGSVLVVVGLWWLVRTVLSLMIHLICPVLVVLLAVICVPQLRGPLLGQNYPALANLMRNILIKLAETIKT